MDEAASDARIQPYAVLKRPEAAGAVVVDRTSSSCKSCASSMAMAAAPQQAPMSAKRNVHLLRVVASGWARGAAVAGGPPLPMRRTGEVRYIRGPSKHGKCMHFPASLLPCISRPTQTLGLGGWAAW